ncbi:unnamed protein product [Effrenium voratum]|uniref:RRM domain-containing protein n=1 Tax=Effrenium voratum TaxID=2562239 RepID=A0AA36MXY2_9DINO|nr:unnamed protein product [Effrenium voratum]
MTVYEPRLPPLPLVFVCKGGDESSSPVQIRRSRSFSGYVPYELSYEEPQEAVTVWPDTDDEELWQDRKESVRSYSAGMIDAACASSPGTCEIARSLESTDVERSGSSIEDADARKLQVRVSLEAALPMAARAKCSAGCMLPIPHRDAGYATDAVLATNPQSTPMSRGMITARASPVSSTPIAAGPHFSVDEHSDASDDEKGYSTCKSRASRSSRLEGSPKALDNSENTTMMIRSLPEQLTQRDLLNELNQFGLAGLYDFCYLPRDFKSVENKGYAFVNFTSPETASMFRNSWNRRSFPASSALAGQQLVITSADVQGLASNLKKWCGPRLRRIRNPELKPYVSSAALETEEPSPDSSHVAGHVGHFGHTSEHASAAVPPWRSPASSPAGSVSASPGSKQVMQAMRAGAIALQKARAMMPATDLRPLAMPKCPQERKPLPHMLGLMSVEVKDRNRA